MRSYRDIDLASRIEGATPYGLVSILYDELKAAIDVLDKALENSPRRDILDHHQRAATILRTLEVGLDREAGGPLAASLAAVYAQLQRRLVTAREGNHVALADVRAAVANLAEAWSSIA